MLERERETCWAYPRAPGGTPGPPSDPLAPCGPPPGPPPGPRLWRPPDIVVLSSAIWGYLSIRYNPLQSRPISPTISSRPDLCCEPALRDGDAPRGSILRLGGAGHQHHLVPSPLRYIGAHRHRDTRQEARGRAAHRVDLHTGYSPRPLSPCCHAAQRSRKLPVSSQIALAFGPELQTTADTAPRFMPSRGPHRLPTSRHTSKRFRQGLPSSSSLSDVIASPPLPEP